MTLKDIQARLRIISAESEKSAQRLSELSGDVESIHEEQQGAFDNMPESLQQSERGETSQQRADRLQEIAEAIQECADNLNGLDFDIG